MTGKELKQFAARVDNDAVIEARFYYSQDYCSDFMVRAVVTPDQPTTETWRPTHEQAHR